MKRRNQTQRQRRTQVAPETRPQEIQTQSATQEADTMKDTMANVRRVSVSGLPGRHIHLVPRISGKRAY